MARSLVVDDVGFVRQTVVNKLKQLGVSCSQAASGADALTILSQDPQIELMLADEKLPDMTAAALREQARAYERLTDEGAARHRFFVVLRLENPLSAQFSSVAGEDEAALLGFDGVLKKPISDLALREMLQRWRAVTGHGASTEMAHDASMISNQSLQQSVEEQLAQFRDIFQQIKQSAHPTVRRQLLDFLRKEVAALEARA
jgi:CheY-like chemotaxis protein